MNVSQHNVKEVIFTQEMLTVADTGRVFWATDIVIKSGRGDETVESIVQLFSENRLRIDGVTS